jgi:hypothetical protein
LLIELLTGYWSDAGCWSNCWSDCWVLIETLIGCWVLIGFWLLIELLIWCWVLIELLSDDRIAEWWSNCWSGPRCWLDADC